MFSEAIPFRSSEHFHMVLRVVKGLSLHTIHSAFSLSKFEVLTMNNEGDLSEVPEEEQREAAEEHEAVEEHRRLVEQFSSLRLGLTAVHPEPNPQQWPPPEGPNRERPRENCLRMLFSDLFQDPEKLLEDCILLTNRVQRHKCDKKYCVKTMPIAPYLSYCKFKFPLPLEGFEAEMQGADFIIAITNRLVELAHEGAQFHRNKLGVIRNHPRIVDTVQEVMQGWRGNTNMRIVESLQQLLQYVLKYMMKPTTGSLSFENIVRDITTTQETDRPASVCQRVLMRQMNEHDMPRTEAVRIVSGLPFVFYSREFRMVNLLGVRRVSLPENTAEAGTGVAAEELLDRRATQDNFADVYWERESKREFLELVQRYEDGVISLPWHPRHVSLYFFTVYFEKSWRLASSSHVPHVSPTFR